MGKTKVAIIGSVGLPANYGGFETLADHLVEELSDELDFTVYCSSKKYKKEDRLKSYKGARLHYIPLEANGVQSVLYDSWSIIHAVFRADVLIVLGVAGAWIFPFIKFFTDKKIIASIDGIEWKREKWSFWAKLYLWWAEKIAVKFSHIDISDNESIQDYTALRYKTLSRVIEYGADHTISSSNVTVEEQKKYPFLGRSYAVSVCRIVPENNVQEILEAFSTVENCPLVMVGNWENSDYGIRLKKKFEGNGNLILLNPIYEQKEIDLIRGHAKVYIHGHSAGGTNPSLVEAMYLGLPVFAFDVSYNRVTTENKAFYFSDSLGLKKKMALTSDLELAASGSQLKSIAQRRYCWGKVALKYKDIIKESFEVKQKTIATPKIAELDEAVLKAHGLLHVKHNQIFN